MNIFNFSKTIASLLALVLGTSVYAKQEQLKVDFYIGGKMETYYLDIDETGRQIEKSTVKLVKFEKTEGDCSRWNTKEVADGHPDGLSIKATPYPLLDGARTFAISVNYYRFLGTRPVEASPGCVVNLASGRRFNVDQSFVVKRGQSLEIFSEKDSLNPENNTTINVEWR